MTLLMLCNSLQESTCTPLGPVVQITDDEAIRERFQSTTEFREWKEQTIPLLKLPSIYLKLSKSRLTGWSTWRGGWCGGSPGKLWFCSLFVLALVVLTALSGYTMAPAPIEVGTLLWATTGTWLCSAAANSFNQVRNLHCHRFMCEFGWPVGTRVTGSFFSTMIHSVAVDRSSVWLTNGKNKKQSASERTDQV